VKPLALMRHLVRLVTPAGGLVLDPFLGSGTTAAAAELEGMEWIGCELTVDSPAAVAEPVCGGEFVVGGSGRESVLWLKGGRALREDALRVLAGRQEWAVLLARAVMEVKVPVKTEAKIPAKAAVRPAGGGVRSVRTAADQRKRDQQTILKGN
jgi:hypothetical protein